MMMATGSLFQRVLQRLWWGVEEKGRMKGERCTGKALGPRLARSTKHTERKGFISPGGSPVSKVGAAVPGGG